MSSIAQPVPLRNLSVVRERPPTYTADQSKEARATIAKSLGNTAAGLYQGLVDIADDAGRIARSYQELADDGGMSRRQIIRLMEKLVADGWVTKFKQIGDHGIPAANAWLLPHAVKQVYVYGDRDSDTYGDKDSDKVYVYGDTYGDIHGDIASRDTPACTSPVTRPVVSNVVVVNQPGSNEPPTKTKTVNPPTPLLPASGDQIDPDFDGDFWPLYPKGRGSKQDAKKLWSKLSADEKRVAMATLPLFRESRDWKNGYQPAPEVWIRGKRWENPPPLVTTAHENGVAAIDWNSLTPEQYKIEADRLALETTRDMLRRQP